MLLSGRCACPRFPRTHIPTHTLAYRVMLHYMPPRTAHSAHLFIGSWFVFFVLSYSNSPRRPSLAPCGSGPQDVVEARALSSDLQGQVGSLAWLHRGGAC